MICIKHTSIQPVSAAIQIIGAGETLIFEDNIELYLNPDQLDVQISAKLGFDDNAPADAWLQVSDWFELDNWQEVIASESYSLDLKPLCPFDAQD